MATQKQIAANRRNSQKSTGPTTPEGKSVSRFNALKHGIDAKSQCLPSENKESLETLAAEYHHLYAPATPQERALVDILISSEWELRRFRLAGAQLWQWADASHSFPHEREKDLPMADGFQFCTTSFMRLQRVIDSTQRNYLRALKALEQLQAARPEPVQVEEPKASTPQLASFRKHPASSPSAVPEPAPAAVATPLPPAEAEPRPESRT
jgi:hypothetical protein